MRDSVEKAAVAEVVHIEQLLSKLRIANDPRDADYREWLTGLLARFKQISGLR